MALDKIKDLIYELDEIDADMEDLQIYASMAIEKNLNINVDFTFFDGESESNVDADPVSILGSFFYASSTSPTGVSNKDQWSMVKSIDQSMMLKMFGLIIEDLMKKRRSVVGKLKKLGVNEGAADTVKKN